MNCPIGERPKKQTVAVRVQGEWRLPSCQTCHLGLGRRWGAGGPRREDRECRLQTWCLERGRLAAALALWPGRGPSWGLEGLRGRGVFEVPPSDQGSPSPGRPMMAIVWFLNPLKSIRYLICTRCQGLIVTFTQALLGLLLPTLLLCSLPGYLVKKLSGAGRPRGLPAAPHPGSACSPLLWRGGLGSRGLRHAGWAGDAPSLPVLITLSLLLAQSQPLSLPAGWGMWGGAGACPILQSP